MNSLSPAIKFGFPSAFGDWLKQLIVASLYLLLGIVVHRYFISLSIVSVFWPGSGLALAALIIGGRRYLWGLLLGSLVLNILSSNSLWIVFGFTLANVSEALLAAWLLERNDKFSSSLNSLPDYWHLIAWGGGVAGLVGAFFGSLSLLLAGYMTSANYLENALHWWMGDVLGVALVTPLILALSQSRLTPLTVKQWVEKLLLVGVTFIAGQIIFLGWFHVHLSNTPKGYVMFFFVSWAAVRLGLRWTTFIVLMIAIQALSGAYQHVGFFANDIAQADLHNYWAYMIILSVVGITIASYINEINQALEALKLKDSALNAAANGIVITDIDGKVQWTNPAFSHMTGFSFEEASGHKPNELVKSGRQADAFYKALWETILSKNAWSGELINQRKDGTQYDESMTITPIINAQNEITHFVAVKQDITERKLAEDLLIKSERNFRFILENSPIAVRITSQSTNQVIFFNKAYSELIGIAPDMVIGINPAQYYITPQVYDEIVQNVRNNGKIANKMIEFHVGKSHTETKWALATYLSLTFENENAILGWFYDITESKSKEVKRADELVIANIELAYQSGEKTKRADELAVANVELAYQTGEKAKRADELAVANVELAYQTGEKTKRAEEFQTLEKLHIDSEAIANEVSELAFHDALTELPNRRLLIDRLSQAMSASKRSRVYGALMFLDLDNFKSLNDTHGHTAGDLLLIEAAQRLTNCMRDMDTVARFGGDEFVVMLAELDEDKNAALAQAAIVADKIRIALSEPYVFTITHDEQADTLVKHRCTASVGVTMFIDHESSQDDIMKRADAAMYQAKESGRNQIRFYGGED